MQATAVRKGGGWGGGLGAQCAGTELLTSTIFFSVNLQMSPNTRHYNNLFPLMFSTSSFDKLTTQELHVVEEKICNKSRKQ